MNSPSVPPKPDDLESICMRNLLTSSEERIYFKDLEGRFILVSTYCVERMAPGATVDAVLGKTDFDFFDEASAREFFDGEQRIIETGESQVGILEVERWRDGTTSWVSTTKLPLRHQSGEIIGTYGISRDVTRQVAAEQALAHQALHDSLTGLANRSLFADRLEHAVLALDRQPHPLAILFIDLDDFKEINDFAGHEAGDRVLVEIARRLEQVTRATDSIARFGGDEFVILCTDLADGDLAGFCDRILKAIETPMADQVAGENLSLKVSASIGVTVTDDPLAVTSELIRDADVAMYYAKQLGGRRFHLIEAGMRDRAAARYTLEMELLRAIKQGEFFMEYQPLLSLADHSIVAVEALIRWQHPARGVVLPGDFLGVAERRGLMGQIGSWVLDTACAQAARWHSTPEHERLTVAVNVSAQQLTDPAFIALVSGTLERHHVPPSLLCLEIAENTLLAGSGPMEETLTALARLGVRIALDDFGTGFASLAHLHRFEVETLKIDRSVVEQLGTSEQSKQIVGAVTAMAHGLGMSVVAEGIETEVQLSELNEMSCDDGQGYLLARPQTAERITELLAGSPPPPTEHP